MKIEITKWSNYLGSDLIFSKYKYKPKSTYEWFIHFRFFLMFLNKTKINFLLQLYLIFLNLSNNSIRLLYYGKKFENKCQI